MSRGVRRAGACVRERGSGTVWMLAFMAVLWFTATVAMVVGGVRTARQRAHAAADLAALAAASRVVEGTDVSCRVASTIAADNGARLEECTRRGRVVDVTVTVDVRSVASLTGLSAVARARAGPVPVPGRRPGGPR